MALRPRHVELGCGAHPSVSHLAPDPIFVDIDIDALRDVRRELADSFVVCADVRSLPFRNGAVQSMSMRAVLHHLAPVDDALTEFARALAYDGTLAVVDGVALDPAKVETLEAELSAARLPGEPVYGFDLNELTSQFGEAGLDVEQIDIDGTATFATPPFVSREYTSERFHLTARKTRGATRGHSSRVRQKLEIDLGNVAARDAVGAEQIDYYRRRAPWYDDVYTSVGDYDQGAELNARWRDSVAGLQAIVDQVPLRGECVELGMGTGFWSAHIINRVDRLWGLDASPEMLDRAQERLADNPNVHLTVTDLWHWLPDRRWDCAVAFFFIEHVPDEVLPALLTTLHDALRPGGCVFVAEGAARQPEPVVETREVDGHTLRVVERRRTEPELRAAFRYAGFDVDIGHLDDYVYLTATRLPSPGPVGDRPHTR
ncbi:MAG: methyltransferase domain-containing protein [Actinomycetota bacterium]